MNSNIKRILSYGGDSRIILKDSNRNAYGVATSPENDECLLYSSSTGLTISKSAFDHLNDYWVKLQENRDENEYANCLQLIRNQIRKYWGLNDDVDIFFSPSGTDTEYILPYIISDSEVKIRNIVVLPEEIGSGGVNAAKGLYHNEISATGNKKIIGDMLHDKIENCYFVKDHADIESVELSAVVTLLHQVYVSKTGKIFPNEEDIRRFIALNPNTHVVVDACQGRISRYQIRKFLSAGRIVMLTGSKFIGGQPFSGITLVPQEYKKITEIETAVNLDFLSDIFSRSELPRKWSLFNSLEVWQNWGLLLRLESAIFEIEKYCACDAQRIKDVIECYLRVIYENFNDDNFNSYNLGDESDCLTETIVNVRINNVSSPSEVADIYDKYLKEYYKSYNIQLVGTI